MPDRAFLVEAGALRDSTLVRQFQRVQDALDAALTRITALEAIADDHEDRITVLEP